MRISLDQFNRLDDDRTLALILLAFGVAIFVASYSYSEEAATWPRFIAACMIIGCLLVLFQNQLPVVLQEIVKEDYQTFDQDNELREQADEQISGETSFNPEFAVFTVGLLILFAVLVLLIGYVVATVFFVLVYGHYAELERKYVLAILALCLFIFYVVGPGLNIPIFEGLLNIAPELTVRP